MRSKCATDAISYLQLTQGEQFGPGREPLPPAMSEAAVQLVADAVPDQYIQRLLVRLHAGWRNACDALWPCVARSWSVLERRVPALPPPQEESRQLEAAPNYWVPLHELSSPKTTAEEVVAELYAACIKNKAIPGIVGAEYWLQVGWPRKGVWVPVTQVAWMGQSPLDKPARPAALAHSAVPCVVTEGAHCSCVSGTTPPRLQIYEQGRGLGFHMDKVHQLCMRALRGEGPGLPSTLPMHGSTEGVPSWDRQPRPRCCPPLLDRPLQDEHVMATEGKMVNPLLSSVLYLTGSTESAERQGVC